MITSQPSSILPVQSLQEHLASRETRRIRIIGFNNQKGLSKDINLLRQALLALGLTVTFCETREQISASRKKKFYAFTKAVVKTKLALDKRPEVSIFLERLIPELLGESEVNLLIPNPEWFHPAWRFLASSIDAVLCKTDHAIEIYSKLGFRTQYLGFTSPDRQVVSGLSKVPQFLHVAGGSHYKGTEQLVKIWEKHPEWPPLIVITHRILAKYTSPASNVSIVTKFMPEEELLRLQNECLFHVYPSQAEGFGHCINEAMSCGAIVFTNDAAPMNELVGSSTGFQFACHAAEKQCLVNLVNFDEASFVQKIEAAIAESPEQKQLRSQLARDVYEHRDRCFRETLQSIIGSYV